MSLEADWSSLMKRLDPNRTDGAGGRYRCEDKVDCLQKIIFGCVVY